MSSSSRTTTDITSPPTQSADGNRFELLGLLGSGGMGDVHLAWDAVNQQTVALKTLRAAGPDHLLRLKEEFRVLADIRHPNLVRLFDLVVTPHKSFFTMEFIREIDLVMHAKDWTTDIDPTTEFVKRSPPR